MTVLIFTDFLAIILLALTIGLARKNIIINNNKNKVYITLSYVVIIILLLEIATLFLGVPGQSINVIPNRIADCLGFSLCPFVTALLVLFNNNLLKVKSFFKSLFAVPLYINILICVLSYKTGWVFYIDSNNIYTRGTYFLFPEMVALLYLLILIITIIKNKLEYEDEEIRFLLVIIIIPIISSVIQITFSDVLLIWMSTAISLVMYYIFLRELQFKYDIQTGIRNRYAFEQEVEKLRKANCNVAIVIVDINDLKRINDRLGHSAGDEIIKCSAGILEESFLGIGKTYRIGGDEFCVLCKEISRSLLDTTLNSLDMGIHNVNILRDEKIELAYGYSFYTKNESSSIYASYIQADMAMYEHKAMLKGKVTIVT